MKKLFLIITLSLVFISCLSDKQITGEVKVVTEDNVVLRFSNISVCAIEASKINKWIESKKLEAKKGIYESKKEYEEARNEFDIAKEKFIKIKATAEQQINTSDNTNLKDINNKLLELKKQAKEKADYMVRAEGYLLTFMSPRYYLSELTLCDMETSTDSKGEFTLNLEGRNTYAIVAKATTGKGVDREEYYWLNWIKSNKIVLTNDNLMSNNPETKVVIIAKSDFD